ncbi:MAG: hypothetical protein MK165_02380 [Pirellulaceae bacterium]|nr:hypothetical protein [Pirellulaceae bacterium]
MPKIALKASHVLVVGIKETGIRGKVIEGVLNCTRKSVGYLWTNVVSWFPIDLKSRSSQSTLRQGVRVCLTPGNA